MILKPPQAMLFDLGGTLLREIRFDRTAGRTRILQIANNPQKATLADYAAIADELITSVYANRQEAVLEFSLQAFGRLIYERLELSFDISPQQVEQEFWDAAVTMELQPGANEMLQTLHQAGLPMAVLSNSVFTGKTLEKELQKHNIAQYLQFVISSADYGIRKPHPTLFRTAAAKLHTEPQKIWFAGDSLNQDIRGAANTGLTPIWYNPDQNPPGPYTPHIQIQHWRQLTEKPLGPATSQ